MKKSRKFISMPVISLEDGQEIGQIRGLVINPSLKSVSALLVEQRKWFKDQKIIPFQKIRSIGDDAITIEKNSTMQKPANLPEIFSLVKDKIDLIGAKVIAENGTTLGYVDEYFIELETGKITLLEVSGNFMDAFLKGKAHLSMDQIMKIGKNVLVAVEGAEIHLKPTEKGLQETLRNFKESSTQFLGNTWEKTVDLSKNLSKKIELHNQMNQDKSTAALEDVTIDASEQENKTESKQVPEELLAENATISEITEATPPNTSTEDIKND